jgi:hypothetical protein
MMRRVSFRVPLAFLALTVACQTCDGEQTGSLINPAKTFGNRIAEVHSEMTETRYSHSTKIDLEKGVLICDCSGFFDFILREEFPEHYLSLRGKEQPTRVRPLAVTYHETFTSVEDQGSANGALSANGASANGASANGAWASIPSLMDARPGDIIAWRKKEIRKGSTTGHVCMVASHPEPIGEGLVKVQLIDSTTDPHENDTRPVGTNGVGSGHRTFVVDTSGQPIGKLNGSKRNASNIAIGRMIPLKQKTSVADDLQYLDLPKAEAVKLAEAKGMRWHIIREDGDPQLNNWTIDEERLSFVVVDGKIHHVFRG